MSEIDEGMPNQAKQLANFVRGVREVRAAPHNSGTLQKGVLWGLSSLIPQEVKTAGILENPRQMAVIDRLFGYQVAVNDRIDFEGSGRIDIPEVVQEAKEREAAKKEELSAALVQLPPEQRQNATQNIQNYLEELEVLESDIRMRRDAQSLTFDQVDVYRNLVNAMYNVAITSIIFPDVLKSRISALEGIIPQSIAEKYAWIMGSNPANNTERAIMIMHNAGMATQVDNDWQGHPINSLLNTPTYASAALEATLGNADAAKDLINRKVKDYEKKAQVLGLGKLQTKGIVLLYRTLKKSSSFGADQAHRKTWVGKKLEGKHPLFRERVYMEGKLDKKPKRY